MLIEYGSIIHTQTLDLITSMYCLQKVRDDLIYWLRSYGK